MKKPSIWSRIGDFLLGKGFYMVLLLCVMAIGGSGYYLYQLVAGTPAGEQAVSAPAEVTVESPAQPVAGTEEEQALEDALAQARQAARQAEQQARQPAQQAETPKQDAAQQAPQQETPKQAEPPKQQTAAPAEDTPAQQTAAPQEEAQPTVQPEPEEESRTTFAPPVAGEAIAAFSDQELTYNAALGDWRTHNGVDLSAQLGDPVSAVLDGEVLSIQQHPLLGTTIVLNHGGGLQTVYGNLAPEVTVEQGDAVLAGETLGSVGNTAAGEINQGAWLHFAVEQDGVAVDPMDYIG